MVDIKDSGFGSRSTAEEVTAGLDLSGKTFLLTGCNSGLGLETLRVIGQRGGTLIAAARSRESAAAALAGAAAKGTPVACDLSEPASVRAAVAVVKAGPMLDGIICNAGIMALPILTVKHGLELQFLTNHVGHFLLVTGLVDRLNEKARVVVLSSAAHTSAPDGGIELDNLDGSRGYSGWKAYGQAKLANLLFARHLAKRIAGSKRTANAVHPGVIKTNLARHMNPLVRVALTLAGPLFLKSVPQGAATQCFVATHPTVEGVSGEYFADCGISKSSRYSRDEALAEKLWVKTEEIVARLA